MSRINFVRLCSILALTFGASPLSAHTITHAVGNCRPGLRSFPTISAALTAAPSADVVEVCPGTYREQVRITRPVTLEGVSRENAARAIIASPVGGLVTNAMDDLGRPLAVQLWVNNTSGPVNINDLTLDGSGNLVPRSAFVVGIFYENSSGTVNRVVTRKQRGNGSGIGIYAQGGSSSPLVTIANDSIRDWDDSGILVETNSATPELTAVIKENELANTSRLDPDQGGGTITSGIELDEGVHVTVTNNFVTNPQVGIAICVCEPLSGSVSRNTVTSVFDAILAGSDTVSVTSNNIWGSAAGILVEAPLTAIQLNTIVDSTIGIEFACTIDQNVQSNIVADAVTGFDSVPSLITKQVITRNRYFNVNTIRTGSC